MEYNAQNELAYNNWRSYQTQVGIMTGNTHVTGPWDHAVAWIAEDWTPRAIAGGLTHVAHAVSPESLAALSAGAMFTRIGASFQMRVFSKLDEVRQRLRQKQQAAKKLA